MHTPPRAFMQSSIDFLRPLASRIAETVNVGSAEAIWSCEGILREAHSSGLFARFINHELSGMRADAERAPYGMVPLLLADSYKLSAVTFGKSDVLSAYSLRNSAEHALVYVVGPWPLEVELYEQRAVQDHDTFKRDATLTRVGRQAIAPGNALRITAGITVVGIAADHPPTTLLSLHGSAKYGIVWEYSPQTLSPIRAISSSIDSTRLEFALTILAEAGSVDRERSVQTALTLLAHPHHFVRWRAAGTLNALAPETMTAILRRLSSDPHPEIQRAAKSTLASGKNGCGI